MAQLTEAQKTWHAKYEYFKDFENSKGWEHIRGFAALVAQIRDSPYSAFVYARTSHQHLTISKYGDFEEALRHSSITVSPDKNAVKIAYYSDTGQMLETAICSYEGAWRNFVRILERLLKTAAQ